MTFSLYQNNRAPSITDTIKVGGAAFNLTGSTVTFKMRLKTSATLKVSTAATIVNPPGADGKVRYDWAAQDVDTPGDFVGWWSVTLPSGAVEDSPEFDIQILTHAPDPSLVQETALQKIRARLKLFTDSDAEPVLTNTDLDTLLAQARRVDLFGNPPDLFNEWTSLTPVAVGDTIVPVGKRGDPYIPIIRNGYYYTATQAGVTDGVEPAWPTAAGTVADGSVIWSYTGSAPWNPTYDIYYAVAHGWLLKASRCAGHYNFMSGGRMFSRQQVYDHCMKQYKVYAGKSGVKGIRLGKHSPLGGQGLVETNADG